MSGDDEIADYVLSVSFENRSLTSGEKAMYRAVNLARQGKRRISPDPWSGC